MRGAGYGEVSEERTNVDRFPAAETRQPRIGSGRLGIQRGRQPRQSAPTGSSLCARGSDITATLAVEDDDMATRRERVELPLVVTLGDDIPLVTDAERRNSDVPRRAGYFAIPPHDRTAHHPTRSSPKLRCRSTAISE